MRLIRLLKKDLARESWAWVERGLITEEQAESICAHYGIDYHDRPGHTRGYHVLTALGYLFVGLSLITLIGANWEEMPRALRMSGLMLVTLAFNLLGLYQFRRGRDSSAVGLFFLGGLCYGASIMLISQIYHIGEHFPDGILWWAIGVLPAALLLESTVLMTLATALAFVWFFVEAGLGYYPGFFLLFMAALAWHVLRRKQSNILFLALVAGVGTVTEYSLSWHLEGGRRFAFGPENVAIVIALFLFFYGASQWLSNRGDHRLKDYGLLLHVWSLRFTIISLFVFSFEEPWREMIRASWKGTGLVFLLSCAMAGAAFVLARAAKSGTVPLAVFSACYFASLAAVTRVGPEDGITLQIAGNIVLVATGVWLIVRGIRSSMSHYFYLGIVAVMGTALLRYIDLVGDYIGAAVLFAFFAVILLATARYWKTRVVGGAAS